MTSEMAEIDLVGGWFPTLDQADEFGEQPLGGLHLVGGDGGQRDHLELGLGYVVVADHRDVLRHPPAGFAERSQHTHRHLVVGHEDRGQVVVPGELETLPVPRSGGPVAVADPRHRATGLAQGRPPAGRPLLRGVPVPGSGQVPDGPVAESQQILRHSPGRLDLIDIDHRLPAEPGDPARAGDHRDVAQPAEIEVHEVARHLEHQALDAPAEQVPDAVGDGLRARQVGQRGQGERVAVPPGGLLDDRPHGARVRAGACRRPACRWCGSGCGPAPGPRRWAGSRVPRSRRSPCRGRPAGRAAHC